MSDLSKVCSRLGNGAASYVWAAQLDDLSGYWLELACCNRNIRLPCKLLARQRRESHHSQPARSERLSDLVPRMRCKECGSNPREVYLNETPHRLECKGPPPGWSVQLVPVIDPATFAEAAE